MVEGMQFGDEKPSQTEVLGMMIDEQKIKFITNVTHENIEGYNGLTFWTEALFGKKDISTVFEEIKQNILTMKCAVPSGKKGNRVDQIVDALKHIIEDKNQEDAASLIESARK